MDRRLLVGILFCMVIAISSFAKAEKRLYKCPTIKDDTDVFQLADNLVGEGEEYAQKNKYKHALKKFLCAATIYENMNTTYYIAQAAREEKNKRYVMRILNYFVSKNPGSDTAYELKKIVYYLEKKKKKK